MNAKTKAAIEWAQDRAHYSENAARIYNSKANQEEADTLRHLLAIVTAADALMAATADQEVERGLALNALLNGKGGK